MAEKLNFGLAELVAGSFGAVAFKDALSFVADTPHAPLPLQVIAITVPAVLTAALWFDAGRRGIHALRNRRTTRKVL